MSGTDDNTPRPFIGIGFECCRMYARIYRNPAGTAYTGRWPRCGGRLRVEIGSNGTDSRFFRAR